MITWWFSSKNGSLIEMCRAARVLRDSLWVMGCGSQSTLSVVCWMGWVAVRNYKRYERIQRFVVGNFCDVLCLRNKDHFSVIMKQKVSF